MKYFVILVSIILLASACRQDVQECYDPTSTSVKIGFRVIDTVIKNDNSGRPDTTVEIKDTLLYYPQFTSLDQDSNIIFKGDRSVNNLSLFLNPEKDSMRFVFQPNEDSLQQLDTLTFYYNNYNHFISNDCGYTYYYNLKKVLNSKGISDSVFINSADVNASAQPKNIYIYFID